MAEHLRNTEFGNMKLPNEAKLVKNLEDDEVVIAYATFLLMIIGRKTTSNVTMNDEQDWYATNIKHRTVFINGFYAAWYNMDKTWDEKDTTKYRPEHTANGFVAALGSLRASAIGER